MNFTSAPSKFIRYGTLSWIALLLLGCSVQPLVTNEGASLSVSQAQPISPLAVEGSEDTEVQASSAPSMASMPGPYPTTLEEFLDGVTLIVIAEIGEVEYGKLYGYDSETGKLREPDEEELKNDRGLDIADFTLKVEETLWADETILQDDPVILRVLWDPSPRWAASMERAGLKNFATGDRYLFMLGNNPDGTFGVAYDEHRLLVDDQGVLYYSQMAIPYPVKYGPFTEGERYGEERGMPLTVDDLVRAAAEGASLVEEETPAEPDASPPVAAPGGALVAPPAAVASLLDAGALIFTGEVGPVLQYLDFGSYNGVDGRPNFRPTEPDNVQLSGLPLTDLELRVEEVLRDDGTIAQGGPVVLRMLGFATAESKRLTAASEFPLSFTGDRHLWILARNLDGTYGLAYGPWSRLIVEGDALRVSNGVQEPFHFAEDEAPMTFTAFKQAIADAAQAGGIGSSD